MHGTDLTGLTPVSQIFKNTLKTSSINLMALIIDYIPQPLVTCGLCEIEIQITKNLSFMTFEVKITSDLKACVHAWIKFTKGFQNRIRAL